MKHIPGTDSDYEFHTLTRFGNHGVHNIYMYIMHESTTHACSISFTQQSFSTIVEEPNNEVQKMLNISLFWTWGLILPLHLISLLSNYQTPVWVGVCCLLRCASGCLLSVYGTVFQWSPCVFPMTPHTWVLKVLAYFLWRPECFAFNDVTYSSKSSVH